ncbi:MAG: hypothetical protein H6672_20275 [Anaerolineaceae bacterium]|nr:hypothetical protein [Anaerolineaceae bacterium]
MIIADGLDKVREQGVALRPDAGTGDTCQAVVRENGLYRERDDDMARRGGKKVMLTAEANSKPPAHF